MDRGHSHRRFTPLVGEALEERTLLALTVQLVKDINPSGSAIADFDSDFGPIVGIGQVIYFAADDGLRGRELWRSDGTAAGTVLVRDINRGANGSNPRALINVNGTLFFTADDGVHGEELWKSDGTPAGTRLVKEVSFGPGSFSAPKLTVVNDTVFFVANDGVHGAELWKSDGTEAGTLLVKDIDPRDDQYGPFEMINVNGTLFFNVDDEETGLELWKSEGTADGTVLVKDIRPGPDWSGVEQLTNVNGTLFFEAFDQTSGGELWKSDGTANGTVLVKDIVPGSDGSLPYGLTNVNGMLLFTASDTDPSHPNSELWRSDGTSAGTLLVKEIAQFSNCSCPEPLALVDGTLFFRADNRQWPAFQNQLWKTDGTDDGTILLRSLPLQTGTITPQIARVGASSLDGSLYFNGYDLATGQELWTSDGSESGTVLVQDIRPGSLGSDPQRLMSAGGTLFFSADDGIHGRELWMLADAATPPTPEIRIDLGVLQIVGSHERDRVIISLSGNQVLVRGMLGQTPVNRRFGANSVRRIVVHLGEGNDTLIISGTVRHRAFIDAGAGNDMVMAGGGAAILSGGEGNDVLMGGSRRNVLIGGTGQDQLFGGGANDLLISGTTAFDDDQFALLAIQQEWISSHGLVRRMTNLGSGSGSILEPLGVKLQRNVTVFGDDHVDTLFGGADTDWFFVDRTKDKARDRNRLEPLG